jgi:MFS family permease
MNRHRAPWFYGVIPQRIGAGSTISLPPLFITEVLHGTVGQVGLASSLTSAAGVPAAMAWGWLSDRFGSRKLYLALGCLGFGIPTLLMAFSRDMTTFLALTILIGALSVVGTPVSSTLIMDTTPKGEWDDAFGRFNQVTGWGMVVGRALGLLWIGYLTLRLGNEPTQRLLWLLSGLLGCAGALAVWVMAPRLHRAKPASFRWQDAARAWRSRRPGRTLRAVGARLAALAPSRFRWREPLGAYYLASLALFTASVFAYTPFAVWQRQDLGNSTTLVFLVGMVNSVAATFSYRWVGKRSAARGSLGVQIAAVALRIVVFGGFALLSLLSLRGLAGSAALIIFQAISGLSWAGIAVAGNTTVAHLAPKGSEGAAVGAYNSFISIGAIVGALASGYVAQGAGFTFVFLLGAVGMAITAFLLILIRRQTRRRHIEHM